MLPVCNVSMVFSRFLSRSFFDGPWCSPPNRQPKTPRTSLQRFGLHQQPTPRLPVLHLHHLKSHASAHVRQGPSANERFLLRRGPNRGPHMGPHKSIQTERRENWKQLPIRCGAQSGSSLPRMRCKGGCAPPTEGRYNIPDAGNQRGDLHDRAETDDRDERSRWTGTRGRRIARFVGEAHERFTRRRGATGSVRHAASVARKTFGDNYHERGGDQMPADRKFCDVIVVIGDALSERVVVIVDDDGEKVGEVERQ